MLRSFILAIATSDHLVRRREKNILLLKPSVKFLILDPCSSNLVAALKKTRTVVNLVLAGPRCLVAAVTANNYLLVPRDDVTTIGVEPNQLFI